MADELSVQILLSSPDMTLRDVVCRGMCRRSERRTPPRGRIFFPEERPEELNRELRALWGALESGD